MRVRAIKNFYDLQQDKRIEKDQEFEVEEKRAKELASSENKAGEKLVEILEEQEEKQEKQPEEEQEEPEEKSEEKPKTQRKSRKKEE